MTRLIVYWILMSNSMACLAADSVSQFSDKLIAALNEQDARAFEALILPESFEKDREKNRKKIALILMQKRPADYKSFRVEIVDIGQYKDYDSATNSMYLFGNKRATFPIDLQKHLTIFVSEENEMENGKWTTPLLSQVLSNLNGRWYMVWPSGIN